MLKLDHLSLVVRDWRRSRDWYASVLGMCVEFEIEAAGVAAMQDDGGLTLFLGQGVLAPGEPPCALTFQVDDVEATYADLARRGVPFVNPPSRLAWGYGAELRDPDGYLVRLWDERTMAEKGGG
jgi:catechol 2,3-dioxygenase-like lactoylglutathione lyase family enzyme